MSNWNKKNINSTDVMTLCEKYNFFKKFSDQTLSQIFASILLRKNITSSQDILFFLEDDLRFQHNPFLLQEMDDAVERILSAQEESEKILIFGDSDVDGITSTAILYNQLKRMGIDVTWRLPTQVDEAEGFGLTYDAINYCNQNDITLIITVDCGIVNCDQTDYANELGIDVIITDHHNPQEKLPQAVAVINPKHPESKYPFHDISGAAVSYKLVSALRFSQTDFYNAEICFMNIYADKEKNCFNVDCLKIKNLVKVKELHETIIPGKTSIYDLKLPYFLQNQLIYVWDAKETTNTLTDIFGKGIEFNLVDFSKETTIIHPSLSSYKISDLTKLSLLAKYYPEENSNINALANLYTTYCQKIISTKFPDHTEQEKNDLQLVGLAALADIMPMKNENRILVNNGIKSIKEKTCNGLRELFAKLNLDSQILTSTDLSWTVIPCLNAAGRMDKPEVALKLLLSENANERQQLAEEIYELNEQRKDEVSKAVFAIHNKAEESILKFENKFCVVADSAIKAGLTGLIANKLMSDYQVPSIAISLEETDSRGSIRSNRGIIATDFLSKFGTDFFTEQGGHDAAAGFCFKTEKLNLFMTKLKQLLPAINLTDKDENLEIDAEIPPQYLTPQIFKIIDTFEPYGNENAELVFISKKMVLCDKMIVGKKEPLHLKLNFKCGNCIFPAMYWKKGNQINDFTINNEYTVIYALNRNYFKGNIIPQMIIKDIF